MKTEMKRLPKYGEGKDAQTSPLYLKGAIESARKEIQDLARKYMGISEIFGETRHSKFTDLEERISTTMEGLGFKRLDNGDLGISNGLNEFFMLAFDPGILVIVNFNVERVEIDGVTDTRTTLRSARMVDLN
jgi:hypothetical protein